MRKHDDARLQHFRGLYGCVHIRESRFVCALCVYTDFFFFLGPHAGSEENNYKRTDSGALWHCLARPGAFLLRMSDTAGSSINTIYL